MSDGFFYFIRLSQGLVLLPFLIGLLRLKQHSEIQRILWYLVGASVLTEAIGLYIAEYVVPPNNLAVYNVYAVIQFIFVTRIYYKALQGDVIRKGLDLITILFTLFAVINLIWIQSINSFNTNIIVSSFFFYVALAIVFFYQKLSTAKDVALERNPMFWLNSGMLIYNSGAFLLFVFVNHVITASDDVVMASWRLNAVLSIIQICFYSVALWIRPKE
ncbi:hypothetical protein [Roseivirga sp.]|uniref:hypothetical protein n=1 Tax=Roseivirga sp. TaxID=1964215 RepID=UPI003B52B36C